MKEDIVDDPRDYKETSFDEKEYEEIKILGKKKFKSYERMRNNIDKWTKKKTGKPGYEVTQFLMLLPDLVMLVSRLMIDRRVPLGKKFFLTAVLGYILSPLDIIPDFLPFFGYTDDLFLIIFALDNILNNVNDDVIVDNWSGKENVIDLIRNLLNESDRFLDKNVLKKIKKWIWKKA